MSPFAPRKDRSFAERKTTLPGRYVRPDPEGSTGKKAGHELRCSTWSPGGRPMIPGRVRIAVMLVGFLGGSIALFGPAAACARGLRRPTPAIEPSTMGRPCQRPRDHAPRNPRMAERRPADRAWIARPWCGCWLRPIRCSGRWPSARSSRSATSWSDSLALRRDRVIPREFVDRFLERLAGGKLDRERALELCRAHDSPAARIFSLVVNAWGQPGATIRQIAQLTTPPAKSSS